jgi:hypothetical protein
VQTCSLSVPIQPSCTPSWQCGEWSSCIDGKQARECVDLNNCSCSESADYDCSIISGRPAISQNCSLSCKITDIYAETIDGKQYVFLKTKDLPVENEYKIMGDPDIYSYDRWSGQKFRVITRNPDGSAVLKSNSYFLDSVKRKLFVEKEKVILVYDNEENTVLEYDPVCDYQKTVSSASVYSQAQLASISDIVSRIAQQIKSIFK